MPPGILPNLLELAFPLRRFALGKIGDRVVAVDRQEYNFAIVRLI